MGRKTIDVEKVKEFANAGLAAQSSFLRLEGVTPEQAYRMGIAAVLEGVLHATGNYKGFAYQRSELDNNGALKWGYDNSRRTYF